MQIYRKSLFFFRISADLFVIAISFLISAYVTFAGFNFLKDTNAQLMLLSLLIIWYFTSKSSLLYDEFRTRDFSYELITILKGIIVLTISNIVLIFLLKQYHFSRLFISTFFVVVTLLLLLEKLFFRYVLDVFRKKGRNLRSLIIVGTGENGLNFYNSIRENILLGYNVLGFIDDQNNNVLDGKYLGTLDQLDEILTKLTVDDIIVALPNNEISKLNDIIKTCEHHTTRVKIVPDIFEYVSDKYNVSMFGDYPLISIREDRLNELHFRLLKRGFDFIFTLILFVTILSWLLPIIAIVIKLTSPGPVFYKQERWGRNNKRFYIYKFRSMKVDTSTEIDEKGKYKQATKNDPRITGIGKILRKTNLDELPQFLNVLKGEMSIVGPRPHPTPLNLESKDKVERYMLRHLSKPGITGWAQVNGYRGETADIRKMQKRVNYDIWYIENWTFWLDIQIIFLTLWKMFKGDPNAY